MAPALKGQRVVAEGILLRWVGLSLDQRRILTRIDDPVLVTRIRTAIYTLYQLQVVAERMGLRASGLGPCTLLIDSAMLRDVFEIQWKIEIDENYPDAVVMDPDDQVMLITLRADILHGGIMFKRFSEALPDFLGSKTRRSPRPRARWKHIFDMAPHSVAEFEQQLSELMEQVLWAWGMNSGFDETFTSCPNLTAVGRPVSPAIVDLKEPISKSMKKTTEMTKCMSPEERFAVEKSGKLYGDLTMKVPPLSAQESTQLPDPAPLRRRRNRDKNNRGARWTRRDDTEDMLSHELALAAGNASTSSSSGSSFACDGRGVCAPTVVASLASKPKRKPETAMSASKILSNELERRRFEASDTDWDREDSKTVRLGISLVPVPESSQVGMQLSAEPHLRPQGEERADDGLNSSHQNDADLGNLFLSSAEHSQVDIKQQRHHDIDGEKYYREINSAVLQEHYWGSQEHWSRPLAMALATSTFWPRLLGQICEWRAFHTS